jgi:hypothetical protein
MSSQGSNVRPLPPSPSWRSVLHPNRHLGRSVQYNRREASSQRQQGVGGLRMVHNESNDTEASVRWSSLLAPSGSGSNLHFPRSSARDDSFLFSAASQESSDRALRTGSRSHHYDTTSLSTGSLVRSHHRQPPPFLTIALVKLTEVLPAYSDLLAAGPSYTNAARACSVLDGVIATASPSSSPVVGKTGPRHHPQYPIPPHQQRPTSPLSFSYWLSTKPSALASNSNSTSSSSAMALEGEWETLVSPFLLLASAEAMTADLEHWRAVTSSSSGNKSPDDVANIVPVSPAVSLTGLYQRVNQDFALMQDVLCEPFLRSPHESAAPVPMSATQQLHSQSAVVLASAIKLLSIAVNVRCQLVDLQVSLFGIGCITSNPSTTDETNDNSMERPTLTEAALAVTLFLQTIETAQGDIEHIDQPGAEQGVTEQWPLVGPILTNLVKELQAWKYCIETIAALERCR